MKDQTFELFIDNYNILNMKLNTIISKLETIERVLGILNDDGPKLMDKQIEEIKSKWEKYKKGD